MSRELLSKVNRYSFTWGICFIIGTFCLGASLIPVFNGKGSLGEKKLATDFREGFNLDSLSSSLVDTSQVSRKWFFEKSYANYNKRVGPLNKSILNITILVVLGLLLLFFKPDGIQVSFIALKIPRGLLYLIVIFGALYLWSSMGLQLDGAIDSRLSVHAVSETFVDSNFTNHLNKGFEDEDNVGRGHRVSLWFADNGFLDTWTTFYFNIFDTQYSKSKQGFVTAFQFIGLYLIYGTLFGLLFAVCLVSVIVYGDRSEETKAPTGYLLLFVFIFLIISNIPWYLKHKYSRSFMAFSWLVAGTMVLLWKFYGIALAEKLKRKIDEMPNRYRISND